MAEPTRYLVTSALPYANGPLHIGHIAGAYLPADIYVRFLRLQGKDVVYVCGSDEHGAAITLRAKKESTTPKEIVDKYHTLIKETFEQFGMSFDIYHRTSSQLHHETAAEFFKALNENNKFVQKTTEQFYDEEAGQFLADRYITGTCPKCNYDAAFGDQCESCGSSLSPQELINPKSTLSGNVPVLKETKHWYLPMNEYEDWLKEWLLEGHKEWKTNVYGQCKSWIDGGLQPRAMTRDLDWGVKVPAEGAEGKVLYVWLDAPIGYISATKQWARDNGAQWRPYWQAADTKLVHFIGKDNIVFHCIIFPIILKAKGDFILPDNVPANEFLNLEGDKISTSRNWAVWLHEYLEDFPNKQDELRYVLCSIAPETKDSEFTWADYQARVNNELVAIFGNFVNRAVVLTQKYFFGIVPEHNFEGETESRVINEVKGLIQQLEQAIGNYKFREAQAIVMNIARIGNQYLAETEPWKIMGNEPDAAGEERVKNILSFSLQIAANLAIIFEPFLPHTCEKLRNMLNLQEANWEMAGRFDFMPEGHQLRKAELLFQKIEDDQIAQQVEKLKNNKQQKKKGKPVKPEITFDDFVKLDVRVGEILTAEDHPDADKLLVLRINTGIDERTVVSGIAEHYKKEEVVGKKVCVLLNLKPRKIRGVESEGMVLMAEDEQNNLVFIEPNGELEIGAEVR